MKLHRQGFLQGFIIGITSVMIVVWIVVLIINYRLKRKEHNTIAIRDIKHKTYLGRNAYQSNVKYHRYKKSS